VSIEDLHIAYHGPAIMIGYGLPFWEGPTMRDHTTSTTCEQESATQNEEATLEYIEAMIRTLAPMADGDDLQVLRYLMEMSAMEADRVLDKKKRAQASRNPEPIKAA
jgi:hypothetical protein